MAPQELNNRAKTVMAPQEPDNEWNLEGKYLFQPLKFKNYVLCEDS
jgi:hypothetical protein